MSYIHQHGIRAVSAQRFDEASRSDDACWVVEEETLTIDVEGIGAYTLMWTPTEPVAAPCGFTPGDGVLAEGGVPEVLALAAGFAFTEDCSTRIEDLRRSPSAQDNPGVVRLSSAAPQRAAGLPAQRRVGSFLRHLRAAAERVEDDLRARGIPPVGDQPAAGPHRLDDHPMAAMRRPAARAPSLARHRGHA